MEHRTRIPIYSPEDIPDFTTVEEERAFWDTHRITQEYADALPENDFDEAIVG